MAFHSRLADTRVETCCGLPLLPLNTSCPGPAPAADGPDIIDESLDLYRPNCMFQSFEFQGAADKLLVYLQLFVCQCLKRVSEPGFDRAAASKTLVDLALDNFCIPGHPSWPLGGITTPPGSKEEGDIMRAYLKQSRHELSLRILRRCFDDKGHPDKFWTAFAHRRFLNKAL